jgi:hypothetical protein
MSRTYRRSRRRRRGVSLAAALMVLAVLAVLGAVVEVVEHLAVLGVIAAASIVAFIAGRRYQRYRTRRPVAVNRAEPPTWPLPKAPGVADQVAELERLAGRPIDVIIASYQTIQRRYGGKP